MQVIGPGVELGGWIGEGAMGTVYAGRWTVAGSARDVAVKLARGGEDVLAEARALLGLDHPNIVAVLDCGRTTAPWDEFEEGTAYVVLERVVGENLTAWAGVAEAVAAAALRGVLSGLTHAHEHGVLHGDISPGNVLASADGSRFWLTDFGGAGTEGFKASERGAGPTVASDLYSVGALGRFLLGFEHAGLSGLLSEDPAQRPGSASQALAQLSGALSPRASAPGE
jgi:serine/threonine protein kinase